MKPSAVGSDLGSRNGLRGCNTQGCASTICIDIGHCKNSRDVGGEKLTFFNTVLGNLSLALLLLDTLDTVIVVVLDGSALGRLLALCNPVSIYINHAKLPAPKFQSP